MIFVLGRKVSKMYTDILEEYKVYIPDNWVVVKLKGDDPHYRVLAGWSGGYTSGDSWRMNSGIVRVEESSETFETNDRIYIVEYFDFYGSSGSCYSCNKRAYGLRMNTAGVWKRLQDLHGDKVELMPEETKWLQHDWIIE